MEKFSGSVIDLMNQNKNTTCTWSVNETNNNSKNSGRVYVSGKKFRQEMAFEQSDGQKMEIFAVSDGEIIYIWNTDQKNEGMKMKLDSVEAENKPDDTDVKTGKIEGQAADFQNKVEYSCSPWAVDDSKFAIPEDVTFTDLSEMMNQYQNMADELPKISMPPQESTDPEE